MESGLTVAIVTARRNSDTTYPTWVSLRKAFLAGKRTWTMGDVEVDLGEPNRRCRYLGGEWGAVMTSCLADPADHHVQFQLRALELQTRPPDDVLIISRVPCSNLRYGGSLLAGVEPMLSPAELEDDPPTSMTGFFGLRNNKVSRGCSDKNTVLALCQTEYLLVLDDCCLPGPGLVEAAYEACSEGKILLLGHRKLYLPTREQPTVRVADLNTDLENARAFGIWAMPLEYILAINGWNVALDGQRDALDLELKVRMDRYAATREIEYAVHPAAKVYEIEHENPWVDPEEPIDWQERCPDGWRAPGPDLAKLRVEIERRAESTIAEIREDADGEEEDEEDE
jgi:hypothetical protein